MHLKYCLLVQVAVQRRLFWVHASHGNVTWRVIDPTQIWGEKEQLRVFIFYCTPLGQTWAIGLTQSNTMTSPNCCGTFYNWIKQRRLLKRQQCSFPILVFQIVRTERDDDKRHCCCESVYLATTEFGLQVETYWGHMDSKSNPYIFPCDNDAKDQFELTRTRFELK